MTRNEQLLARRRSSVPRGIATACDVFAARADNAEIWDVEGKRYIDFAGGIGVLNTGHRHPRVMQAALAQIERLTHTAFQVMAYEPYIALAERLNGLVPVRGPRKTALFSTGAEAVENAVKIARAATRRPGVLAFSGAFHGRTLLALGLTGKTVPYKLGVGPFPGEIYRVPFPSSARGVEESDVIAGLELLFQAEVEPSRIAALIIEPVQGEGGFNVAPATFLRRLRELCDSHGIVMIVDEIQSGFGRTGRMFAIEHCGVEPDIVVMAKGLAGGFPLSAVTGTATLMDAVAPGGLGGTYGGNPVACAAALAVLDVIEEERLLERSRVLGDRIKRKLHVFAREHSGIGDVRGIGSMLAIELSIDGDLQRPDSERAQRVVSLALENGLVVLLCGPFGNVVRFLVPLTASDALVDEGLSILERSLEQTTADASLVG